MVPSHPFVDEISDDLRARLREELPELAEIADDELRTRVVEAWALSLARSGFAAISEIEPSGNPGVMTLRSGTQLDHIRGVTRLAMRIADEFRAAFPALAFERDIVVAGGICHDVGKPFEFDPERRTRWKAQPGRAGLPALRHPAYGAHICLSVGLPEEVAHIAQAHSGEGELLVRSVACTIVHHADYVFWQALAAGDLLVPESIPNRRR